MNFVRSALFAALFYPGTVLFVLAALACSPFGSGGVRAVAVGWAHFHRWCATNILRIRTRVEGTIPQGTVIVASKHQSMFETIDLVLVLRLPRIVMKKELGSIPLWGPLAQRYGQIVVDRSGGAAALRRLLRYGEESVAEGRSIIIFPEGTRVAPGEKPPLQPGFAGLYRVLNLPIVPLALDSGRVWPARRFVKRPGIVTMRFGEPIPAGLPRKEIEALVHAGINALEDQPAQST
jgi:1-acyl-sn-glycerol-3-phosphate acyltransferase